MSEDLALRSWTGSYYLSSEKRWRPGRLSLTATHLRFQADGADDFLIRFPLSGISEIKKESSSYIFSSITVLEGGGAKHWFSSLIPSRNAVFPVLEHFWRERLLSPRGDGTSKGKELLGIMSGSQRCMEGTTRVLHHQGEQLDGIMSGLSKIEGDMATADRMLSVLESPSWWPFSGSPWKRSASKEPEAAAQSRGKDGVITTIPIIFCRHPEVSLRPGRLTLLLSALEICDCDHRPLHRYQRQDVDDIRVVSGHEMSVRQRFLGRPDVTFTVISARLPLVLPLLEMQYRKKVEFTPEAAIFSDQCRPSPSEKSPGWQTDSWFLDTIVRSGPRGGGEEAAAMAEQQEVTDSEVLELRKILTKLKSIALEAEDELERQDEALDEITSSTDRAILKINKQTRRMRNLI
ncbi:synaptosomal-associated protein 47 [Bufo gargarizans]|uniref:synaptosomal-associated protein 47 n=1 Tax=Bufo gargarizans TaxID=30331 RepID=UPI001CF12605|nr:synaptosomal-associated protein 47 [Bufo gargarizans]XP_044150044.1 synaptosomal-associated protein 47 [Bufo gargarizans]XP_044150045.1 synaptosomal-associated protein 47 [Bufo gargarizans]XP_044150046.1 synaptosomal-associated protein 47 [Bufo gargarizans]